MVIRTKNEWKILCELFNNTTYSFHLRELARKTGLNPNTVSSIVMGLEKEGTVLVEMKKHLKEIRLNFDSEKVVSMKRVYNLSRIYDSGLLEFLVKTFSPKFITVLGSYSRGEDVENSDIDIIVDSSDKKQIDLKKFEKILKRKIHLLFYDKSMSNEFFNNLINGVRLYGVIRNERV